MINNISEIKIKKISRLLSYWLRHHPEDIGLNMNSEGWVDVKELLDKSKEKIQFDFNELKYIVQNNDKNRFSFSEDYCEIRASQGHSIDVGIDFEEIIPPQILFHGTSKKTIDLIKKEGLKKMNRKYVHLSPDIETASKVGSRKGEFLVLEIEAMKMRSDGYKIFISDNGVFLTDNVPVKYIKLNK